MRHATLALLVLGAAAANAQDYLANDPRWQQHSLCGVPAPCIANDTYNYFTAGDSLIGAVAWTKVRRAGMVSLSWQSPEPPVPTCSGTTYYNGTTQTTSLIRQEGRQLRIWANETDQLLYEFDLQVGQTLPLSYSNWNTDITVIAVDSVLIGTEMRARYELGNSWAQYLIEGVGSSNGLLEPISNFFDCGYGLDCFGLGDMSYYPLSWSGSCELVMGVNGSAEEEAFIVAPNPAADAVSISGMSADAVITVRDAFGRVVLRERAGATSTSLDVSSFADGCYSLLVDDRVKRLIVAH
ncbi:MAG: T9SS type A sorting domain-containing protein [Flavobacteriales bacterium]